MGVGLESRSFLFDGIDEFNVCLFDDGDCSTQFYVGSTTGDTAQTCHNVALNLNAQTYQIVDSTVVCRSAEGVAVDL